MYLIIETRKLRGACIEAALRPAANALTGNTNTLALTGTTASRLFQAEVGSFNALNNRNGSHDHYVNLAPGRPDHADKAIIKLQLRPETRATFDTWTRRLGNATVNIEVLVRRSNNEPCAYSNGTRELTTEATFLRPQNGFTNSNAVFRVANGNAFEIYHVDNLYNPYPGTNQTRPKIIIYIIIIPTMFLIFTLIIMITSIMCVIL